jgi:hypothetical protein
MDEGTVAPLVVIGSPVTLPRAQAGSLAQGARFTPFTSASELVAAPGASLVIGDLRVWAGRASGDGAGGSDFRHQGERL